MCIWHSRSQVRLGKGQIIQSVLEQNKRSLGQPSVFLPVSEDSLLSVHCVKITFVLEVAEVRGERR